MKDLMKSIKKGPAFLSDEELLAVILRTGNRELNSMELARTIITKENKTDIFINYALYI